MAKKEMLPVPSETDKDWEVECLANKIREVEVSKQDKPELYAKAVAYLKKEAKAVNSLEDLKEMANKSEDEEDAES
jgi:hypothetical protein